MEYKQQDHADVADGKPVDENVESFLSFENEHADHRVAPFSNLKRISATLNKNENKGNISVKNTMSLRNLCVKLVDHIDHNSVLIYRPAR